MKSKLLSLKHELEACVSILEKLISEVDPEPKPVEPIQPAEQPTPVQSVEPKLEPIPETTSEPEVPETVSFETLAALLDKDWPPAVDEVLICNPDSEEDKLNRAEGIIELLIDQPLKEKKFLDFGCGEGQVPYKAVAQEATISVGYDLVAHETWKKYTNDKLVYSTNLDEVKKYGPFDVVLIYDVLDHTTKQKAVEILTSVQELLADKGKVYLRTHPFCSRHSGHYYHKLNKAYLRLVFTPEELKKLGLEPEDTWKVVHPIYQYREAIDMAGLRQESNNILRQRLEPFFTRNKAIASRVMTHYASKKGFPDFQMEQQFLDYILVK